MSTSARILVVDDSPTILKVVGAILARHGYEPQTARDGLMGLEMIKRGPRYDLVLLDFVMPRMNGFQFCRELRSLPDHKDLPVILMSAKGDKIRGQFVAQTGALDAITKPFDSRTLVAAIADALAKAYPIDVQEVPASPETSSETDEAPPESIPPRSIGSRTPSQTPKASTSAEIAQHIASALTPSLLALPAEELRDESAIAAAVARAMTSDVVNSLAMAMKQLNYDELSKEVMSGDISAIALAEILQILQMQRQTGLLRIMNNRTTVAIAIRQGLIDLVQARGAPEEFRIGRYFVERGLVARPQLEAIAESRAPQQLLGETLVAAGLISREELTEALARQSSELVYDVLRWPFGRFSFTRETFTAEAEAAKLGLGVSGLVLEGFRRVDEMRLMEGTINFDQVLVIDAVMIEDIQTDQLPRSEQLVLSCVDGERTVSQVIRESSVGSFDAVKIIYQFMLSRVLRPVTY